MDDSDGGTVLGQPRLVSRRAILRGAAVGSAGLAAAALIGCGSKKQEQATTKAPAPAASAAAAPTDGKVIQDPDLPYPFWFPEPGGKTPKAGGIMHVGVNWDTATLDTNKATTAGTITIPNMVYNRLLAFVGGTDNDPDAVNKIKLKPELAQSWERTPDGLTYTFKIQPGIKWQNVAPLNGRPFTAADVKFTYDRYAAPPGVNGAYFDNVSKVDAVDATTLKITMKRPVADFLNPLGSVYTTIHPKELVDSGDIEKTAVGTGPMIVKTISKGERVIFEKNPDYFARKVLLDGVEFRVLLDASARAAAFRAEQLEYANAVAGTITDVKNIVKTNPKVQINIPPAHTGYCLAMNLASPKFQDVRVRRAISLAMDRPTIKKIVFEDLGTQLPTMPWPFVFDQKPTGEQLGKWNTFDLAQSKALLKAAGVENLAFDNEYYPYATTDTRTAEALVPMFKQAGITMTPKALEYTAFNTMWTGRKLNDITTVGWATSGFDADNYFYAHVHSKGIGNRWRINDPQMDQWAEQQQVELDPQKRREIHRKMWDQEADMAYRPTQGSPVGFEVYQPWLRGIRYGGFISSSTFYYTLGVQVSKAWLDK